MASVYVPPAKGTGSGYCTGSCATQDDNRRTYLAGYFNAHMLSVPSQRYLYLTWIVMAAILVIAALLQHLGLVDQTWIGAAWNRWAIKSRVVKLGKKSDPEKRAKEEEARTANLGLSLPPTVAAQVLNTSAPHRQVVPTKRKIFTFPSFGRMLLLATLVIVPVIFTFVGADYIRPSAGMFDLSESWPNNSLPVNTQGLYRRLQWGIGQYHPVTTTAPSLTLPYRTWWTAGGRTGAMTNALTPFILVTALRQVPFAIFSLKIFGGYGFDRLSFMHKWGGRVLWAFATAHVVLWSIQLDKDQAFGTNIWAFVFLWTRFRWGFVVSRRRGSGAGSWLLCVRRERIADSPPYPVLHLLYPSHPPFHQPNAVPILRNLLCRPCNLRHRLHGGRLAPPPSAGCLDVGHAHLLGRRACMHGHENGLDQWPGLCWTQTSICRCRL